MNLQRPSYSLTIFFRQSVQQLQAAAAEASIKCESAHAQASSASSEVVRLQSELQQLRLDADSLRQETVTLQETVRHQSLKLVTAEQSLAQSRSEASRFSALADSLALQLTESKQIADAARIAAELSFNELKAAGTKEQRLSSVNNQDASDFALLKREHQELLQELETLKASRNLDIR